MRLPISADADLVALCVLGALVVRLAVETIATHLYPRRLDLTEAQNLREPGALQRLAAGAVRMALFVFVAHADQLDEQHDEQNGETFLAYSLLLLSVPGFLLSAPQLFAREGPAPAIGWGKRIAGVGLLAIGIPSALGLLL